MRHLIRWLAVVCLLGATSPLYAQDAPAGGDVLSGDALAGEAPAAAEPAPAEAAPAPEPAPVEPAPVEAAPAEAAPAEQAAPAEEPPEDECALGQTCVGPVLSLGLFNVIGIGAHARHGEMWGFGVDFQFLPISAGDVDVMVWLLTLDGRIYPFGGAFFGSLGFSYQAASFSTPPVDGSIGVPQLKFGLGFMGHDGFVMGIDLAFGIPLGSSDVEIDPKDMTDPNFDKLVTDIEDAGDLFVNALPLTFQLNLLRIGYLF